MAVAALPARRSRRVFRWGALALAGLLAGLVVAVAALPSLVRWGLVHGLERATGMRASLGPVDLRRRTGEVHIGELRVTHPRSGKPVAGWNGVTGRIRYAPLLLGTVRFEAVSFDGPYLALARGEDRPGGDAIPLSAFAARGSRGLLRPTVDLQSLEILRGHVNFFDAAGEGGTVRVEDLMVRVSDLATGRRAAGRRTGVAMSARWEGGHLEVTGWVKPFAQPPEGDLSLRVADLDLSLVDALLFAARRSGLGLADGSGLPALPLTVRSGRADATAHLTRGATGGAMVEATVTARQLSLDLAEGRGHASALSIVATVPAFDLRTWILRDGRIEVEAAEGDLGAFGGLTGRVGSWKATLGSVDLRQRSLQSARLEVAGVTVGRAEDGLGLDGGRVRLTAEAGELATQSARGITLEAEGLALRGVGWSGAAARIGSLRAAAEVLDLGARSGRGLQIQAEGLAGTGLGPQSLSAELQSLRATAAALDLAGRSAAGLRLEAEQTAIAGIGPQALSARLQALRAAAESVDLRARAARGASVAADWLAAARAGEREPLAILRAARAEVPRLDLAGFLSPAPVDAAPVAIEIARLEMDAPTVRVRRDASGIDLAHLLDAPGARAPSAPAGAGPAISPAAVAVGFAQVREGALTFIDATVSPEANVTVHGIAVNLLNARPGGATPATLVASARVGAAGSLQLGVQFTPGTFRNANGTARLDGVDVDLARPYLALPAPLAAITGRLTASAEARPVDGAAPAAGPAWKIVARGEARDLAGRDAAGSVLAAAPVVEVRDVEVTVPDLRVLVGDVAVSGLNLPVERDAAGVARVAGMPLSAFTSRGPQSPPPIPHSATRNPQPPPGGLPPVRVRQVRVTGTVPLMDRAKPQPLETAITNIVLDLRDVGTRGDSAMGLQLRGQLEELRFAAAGATRFGPLRAQAYLDLTSLDVVRWADYLPEAVRGRLADLRGDAHLEVAFGAALSDLVVRGRVEAAPLQLADPEGGDGVLGVDHATLAIERLTLAPLSLHLSDVLLEQPWVNIERRADGRINVLALAPPRPDAAHSAAGGAGSWDTMSVVIDRVTVKDGVFDVADRTMTPAFVEQLKAVAGTMRGLSTGGSSQADFTLGGRLSDDSNFTMEGVAVPRMDRPFVDLRARLGGFNLSGLSPYVRRLTSYQIERGKIEMQVHYRLEESQLQGENRIRIDQLDVGEPTEWPDRFTDLVGVSMTFAVSMLQDSEGVIQLDIPVRGNMAHPEFDFGDAIRTAIKNAVVAAITAPFRWIGRIFEAAGRIGEVEIDPIVFAPASDQLGEKGRQALDRLVAFLREAPRARIRIAGYAEPAEDGKALAARGSAPPGPAGQAARRAPPPRAAPGERPMAAELQALARRRSLAVYEGLLRGEVDAQRLFLGEAVVEEGRLAGERGKPPHGRVEFQFVH